MLHPEEKRALVDRWVIEPMARFINNSTMSGIILFSSAFLALILSNSPWAEAFHHLWEVEFSIGFNGHYITNDLHHWINDGLMAVFFFVVGLELKREVIAGELSNPRKAVLPLAAAIGGMIVPALIYLFFNTSGEPANGWGIPMATDIAFALGVLYLLGDRVPLSLKVFLTALAIADDIGAVLVIAFFYTSNIHFDSLLVGAIVMAILVVSNLVGVRNSVYYAILGIGGLWLAFLMSGVHATIAAVLAAFTIPASAKVSESAFSAKVAIAARAISVGQAQQRAHRHGCTVAHSGRNSGRVEEGADPVATAGARHAPVGGLCHHAHFCAQQRRCHLLGRCARTDHQPGGAWVSWLGLLVGKVVGVVGVVYLMLWLKLAALPEGLNRQHILGAGFLAAIGFTMSLFISGLAFSDRTFIVEAKIGILSASVFASVVGYFIIRSANKKIPLTDQPNT
jgi:Na+:H+ antiporter, NhaA family